MNLLEAYGEKLGLAFQIKDDILDVTGTLETLGKPIGSDEKNHKTTYVTLKGVQTAMQEQQDMSAHAISELEAFSKQGFENPFLMELIKSLITRIK